jgi:glycosyltransferase involved in cell wall biosynthesis
MTADVCLYGYSEQVAELLNCLDVYVQASFYEGFSNTLLEAMACDLPVLATRVGGTADIVTTIREGRLFESNDERALADLIADAWTARDKAASSGFGRQMVVERYSMAAMVRRYESMYLGLCGVGLDAPKKASDLTTMPTVHTDSTYGSRGR